MKKILAIVTGLCFTCCLQAQVLLTLQLPPVGLTIKPQLWGMTMINSSGRPLNVQVQMTMTEISTGRAVLNGASPLFVLPAGVKVMTMRDVSPVAYTAGAGSGIDPSPNGFLPVGTYNICYTVTKWVNDLPEQLADECVTAEVEPISPPQLAQPADSEQVIVTRPLFTWLPPAPYNLFGNLQYDWLLVEVQPTQSGGDAIQQNVPVFQQSNISFTSFQYPLSMPELDSNKMYAWRVTAKNNGAPIANSETWTFSLQTNVSNLAAVRGRGYYTPLRPSPDGSFAVCNGVLRYRYRHEINSDKVQITITDLSNAAHKQLALDSTDYPVKYGTNYIDLDLNGNPGLVDRHMYLFGLTNALRQQWYLKFEYRKAGKK